MKITKEILIDAAKKSLENAKELVVDAIILEKNNRKERAYTLFQFSIEEVGKAISSTLMIFTKGYNDVDRTKEYVRFFKDHKFKTLKSRAVDVIIIEVLCKGDKAKAIEMFQQSLSEVNEIEKINHYKNYSLYTSFYENKVKTPSELISHENLNKVKESAINRLVAATTVVNTALDNLEEMEKYINDHPLDKIDPEEWAKEFWEQFD